VPSSKSNRDYERFLAATLGLIDASATCAPSLSRSRRVDMDAAILRACEAGHDAGAALLSPEPRRLAKAAARLDLARALLADVDRDAVLDAARRRSLSLVL